MAMQHHVDHRGSNKRKRALRAVTFESDAFLLLFVLCGVWCVLCVPSCLALKNAPVCTFKTPVSHAVHVAKHSCVCFVCVVVCVCVRVQCGVCALCVVVSGELCVLVCAVWCMC